jgi:ABC-type glycerol-3-phosphate transport system substrate-binding protein
MKTSLLASLLAAAAALAACGGGGDAPPVAVDDRSVPASATAAPAACTGFVGMLAPDDTAEPLIVEGLQPPVSDEDEPLPVS